MIEVREGIGGRGAICFFGIIRGRSHAAIHHPPPPKKKFKPFWCFAVARIMQTLPLPLPLLYCLQRKASPLNFYIHRLGGDFSIAGFFCDDCGWLDGWMDGWKNLFRAMCGLVGRRGDARDMHRNFLAILPLPQLAFNNENIYIRKKPRRVRP